VYYTINDGDDFMDKNKSLKFLDFDFKLTFGNVLINILYINYEAPISSWAYGSHSHSGYELHFVPLGTGTLRIMNKEYKITPGTLYLTGPGMYHEQIADSIDPMCEYCINFEFSILNNKKSNSDLYLKTEVDSILNILRNTNFWFGNDTFSSIELFEKLILELENKHIGYYLFIQALVSQIILNAIRCFDQHKISDYSIPKKVPDDLRRFAIDHYLEDITRKSSINELSKVINISTRQLNRIVKEYYSMTFKEKLITNRLEYAENLLLDTKLPVNEIAVKSGFSNASYFSTVFQRHFNTSPREFRIQNLK